MPSQQAATPARPGVETLRWVDGRLELIDQRALPARIAYLACTDAAQVAAAIRDMVVRGAPAIGCAAAYGFALEALLLQAAPRALRDAGMESAFAALAASRPTAVNLFWALARMRDLRRRLEEGGGDAEGGGVAAALLAEAHAMRSQDIAINRAIGRHGAALLPDGARVLTHCNAGALATAGYGTALGVIRAAVAAGKRVHVWVDETRPFLQGARLTAWELVQEGIAATLITDNMAGYLMARGEVDAIVVGADRVAANGDVANKIGTYTLAVLAHHHGIPLYVACPLSTFDPAAPNGAAIPIEERAAEEVLGYGGVRWAPAGIAVRNPAFDVTPATLVRALVTEKGVVVPERDAIEALWSD